MNHTDTLRSLCLLALVAFLPILAQAHTALKESTPAADATVKAIPGHLELVFNGPVRLIKLELMGADRQLPTGFKPKAEATANYRIETPEMRPGEFTVNWAAIGADGHTITNSFSFVVDPNATVDHAGHDYHENHEGHEGHEGHVDHEVYEGHLALASHDDHHQESVGLGRP